MAPRPGEPAIADGIVCVGSDFAAAPTLVGGILYNVYLEGRISGGDLDNGEWVLTAP